VGSMLDFWMLVLVLALTIVSLLYMASLEKLP
jgi:hypothetical protein